MARKLGEAEKFFIDDIIGPQLVQERPKAKINVNGKSLDIDYTIIQKGYPKKFQEVVVLVTGFGSGWRGIARLGYDLARYRHKVCMLSLPGYGNSDNPPPEYYRNAREFSNEAKVLDSFVQKILPDTKIHWVGHSMGAAIITTLAYFYPEHVSSLVLLNPAGFEKRNRLEIAVKFILNGIGHGIKFYNDPIWKELQKFLPKEKSPFSSDCIKQRISEWQRSCSDCAMPYFQKIPAGIPFKYLTGEKDFVYPYTDSALVANWLAGGITCYVDPLPGLWHNTTMYGSEKTAEAISRFLVRL